MFDRRNSPLYVTRQIAVDPWEEVGPRSTYTYLIFLSFDFDWLIHSQVSTSERGGCCWNPGGVHHGGCCQSNHHLLHHRRQPGRWVYLEYCLLWSWLDSLPWCVTAAKEACLLIPLSMRLLAISIYSIDKFCSIDTSCIEIATVDLRTFFLFPKLQTSLA